MYVAKTKRKFMRMIATEIKIKGGSTMKLMKLKTPLTWTPGEVPY